MRKTPNRKGYWGLLGLLPLLFLLTACPRGGGAPPPPGGINGWVVSANAGAPVEGATVTVYEAGTSTAVATATTAADGSFTVNLAPGAYDLVVNKAGMAGSKVMNVRVVGDDWTPLPVIQRKAFNPSWPTDPPEVTLEKVADGNTYDARHGYIPYRVRVQPAAPLDTFLIYTALGKTPGSGFLTGQRALFVSVNDTGDQFLDPLDYAAAGPTTFQVVVYDTNGNRTQLIRYVSVTIPFDGNYDLVAPQLTRVRAVTLNRGLDFYSVAPQAAPPGGNLYAELIWRPKTDFSHVPNDLPYGYHIYRSFDGENFERIGTVDGGTNSYVDASPELAPGKKTYYRVTAFVGTQESDPSNVLVTTPLEAFEVHLTAPADDAQNVSVTPTFEWEVSQQVGAHQYYAGAIWDTLTGENAFFTNAAQLMLVDRTSWTWNEDGAYNGTPLETLQRGRSYEWHLIEAYALDDPVHPTAVSIAADGLGLWFPWVPSADHFTFTTAP